MGRRMAGALLLVVSLSLAAASQVISGEQFSFGESSLIRKRLLSDLKKAQEEAGIFVDDAYLFDQSIAHTGRRLQQSMTADATAILSNPTIMAALTSMFASGATVGGFPSTGMNLPGGSAAGYAPTNNSYCLFSTVQNNTATSGSAMAMPPRPGTFSCVQGSNNVNGGFLVTLEGTEYVCVQSQPGVPTTGRRLLAAPAPAPQAQLTDLLTEQNADIFFDNVFKAIGLPIWRCIIATTPEGNTSFGQAALATLNDLGVVAEHFLNYLNNADTISYSDNVKNNFVSLTDPLYPTGPRLNFSIDFASVAKDRALFREIFGFPTPPSPPPPAVTPAPVVNTQNAATQTTGGTVPAGSTPGTTGTGSTSSGSSNTGSSSSTGSSSQSTSSQSTTGQSSTSTAAVTSQSSAGSPAAPVSAPPATPPPAVAVSLAVFDGYLSNCQVVIGSAPGVDGNFDRSNNFQAVIIDGKTSMSMDATNTYNGSVSYVIPASKSVDYAPLTQATRGQAQFCYDIATLLPVYNPIATLVVANSTGMAGNAISTVAVFGSAYGVSAPAVLQALGVSIPAPYSLWTYDALGMAVNGSAAGLAFLKENTAVTNLVTAGANLLTNDSSTYASYAIIMNQAIAKKISYSPPLTTASTTGRKLLQAAPATAPAPPAVDLTNATTVADIMNIALQSASTSNDASIRNALNQGLTSDDVTAVSTGVANLNAQTAAATDPVTTQLSQYYAQSMMANEVSKLALGDITPDQFSQDTNSTAINAALSGTLPGSLIATPAPATPTRNVTPQTQSAPTSDSENKSHSGGLSHGGKVALATVFPIVGVALIAICVGVYLSRRNRTSETRSSAVWYRRPFARSGTPNTV